jgi:hypothetical protein
VNLECVGCDAAFEAPTFRGYCPECIEGFEKQRENVHKRQRPAPGVIADGKFARGSPETVYSPVAGRQVCGLCGSAEIEPGYGLGSGYGMGVYTFCNECYAFLDFSEDTGE